MVGLFPGFYLTGMQYETQLVVKLTGHDELHIPTQQENTEKGVFTDFCYIFFFLQKFHFICLCSGVRGRGIDVYQHQTF